MRPGRQEGNTQLVCGGKTTHYQQQVELVLTWIEHNQKADDYVLLCGCWWKIKEFSTPFQQI